VSRHWTELLITTNLVRGTVTQLELQDVMKQAATKTVAGGRITAAAIDRSIVLARWRHPHVHPHVGYLGRTSLPRTTSRSILPIYRAHRCALHHENTQTTKSATSVAVGRIYLYTMHAKVPQWPRQRGAVRIY